MKKLIAGVVCMTFALTSSLQGAEVGKAAADGATAGKNSRWVSVVIAVGIIAVAVTALVLVSRDKGHKSHAHSH